MLNGIEGSGKHSFTEIIQEGIPLPQDINEMLLCFEKQALGRSIRIADSPRSMGLASEATSTLAGYILPLNKQQTKHLVILSNEVFMIIEPRGDNTVSLYKSMCQPLALPLYAYEEQGYVSVDNLLFEFTSASSTLGSSEVIRNDRKEHGEQIAQAIDTAITIAYELRDERRKERASSVSHVRFRLEAGPAPLIEAEQSLTVLPVLPELNTKQASSGKMRGTIFSAKQSLTGIVKKTSGMRQRVVDRIKK